MKFNPKDFWGISKELKIGSRVRVKKGTNDYFVTSSGSEGFVTKMLDDDEWCEVNFYKLTGKNTLGSQIYVVYKNVLEVIG